MPVISAVRKWFSSLKRWGLDNSPVQRCVTCKRWRWAGWPRYSREWVAKKDYKVFIAGVNCKKAWVPRWLPGWFECCSPACYAARPKEKK